MSIKSRLPKIKQSARQTQLCLKSSINKSIWSVPSLRDPADSYQMIVEVVKTGQVKTKKGWVVFETIRLTCNKIGAAEWIKCNGQHDWNCYHSLGALLKQKPNIEFFDTFNEAQSDLLKNGTIIKITSSQSNSVGWGAIPPKKSVLDQCNKLTKAQEVQQEINQVAQDDPHLAKRLQRMNDRVEMMHGPVEEGIN